ncbi:MAG: adenylate/guanylate cyclase domain-containing protein [Dehalococcoidia bacterium]
MEPRIQYTKTTDGVSIAYYTIGNGPPFIIMSPRIATNIEDEWNIPPLQNLFRATAMSLTVVRYDMRGCGLSDRNIDDFSPVAMMRDLEALADVVAPQPFALLASGTSIPAALTYAASYPDRVSDLMLWAVLLGAKPEPLDRLFRLARTDWTLASESFQSAIDSWSNADDARRYAAMMRRSVTPEAFIRHEAASNSWEMGETAPQVRARTLVMHPRDHPYYPTEGARKLAAAIPDARLVLSEGSTVLVPGPQALAAMAEFLSDLSGVTQSHLDVRAPQLRGDPTEPSARSATAIIVFADIVDSTVLTERLGDLAFRDKARDLDATLRAIIREHSGTAIEGKLLGDGVLAVFTSARQAIEAALACGKAGDDGGLPLHLGLHAGDVIREENNIYGGAVNIASRISGLSAPGEVLVSDTVRSLARTSAGVLFEDRGEHSLKGIEGTVRMYAVHRRE